MSRVLLTNAKVFDGTLTAPAQADVVLDGRLIVDVGLGLDADESVDLAGKGLLPGLFDCHTHFMLSHVDVWRYVNLPMSYRFFEAVGNVASTLHAGITSVREAFGSDLGLKMAVEGGLIEGPRMQLSISMITQTGGHADSWFPSGAQHDLMPVYPGRPSGVADGPDALRVKVREIIRAGADVIKIATSGGILSVADDPRLGHFRHEELEAIVAEASAAGRAVMAHASATEGIKAAIHAGVRSIEHGDFLDDEAIDLMLRNDVYLVPTLMAYEGLEQSLMTGDTDFPASVVEKIRYSVDEHRRSFRKAVEAGVRIAMGTDSGVTPHGQNLRELALMRQGGMSAMQVLVAATSTAAQLLGWSGHLGTIQPGKVADLVVVQGDPLDIGTPKSPVLSVVKDGREVVGRVLRGEYQG